MRTRAHVPFKRRSEDHYLDRHSRWKLPAYIGRRRDNQITERARNVVMENERAIRVRRSEINDVDALL